MSDESGTVFLLGQNSDLRAQRAALTERVEKLEEEVTRLKRVIARELTENDELGMEYTYVIALKEEVALLRQALTPYARYCGCAAGCRRCERASQALKPPGEER